jgi:hypothetical protein
MDDANDNAHLLRGPDIFTFSKPYYHSTTNYRCGAWLRHGTAWSVLTSVRLGMSYVAKLIQESMSILYITTWLNHHNGA